MREIKGAKPKVSIIIVTFNAVKTLQACLDSIYRQSYPNIELIIIDGASNDGTVDLLEKNAQKIDFWVSEKDSGIYDAMNKGLKHISGDWVYFLGADDELLDGFSRLADELKERDAIYYGSVFCRGKKCSGFIKPYYQAKVGMYHQSMMYPAAVFSKHKYNQRYPISADYVLNMELAGDPDFKFEFRDHLVANFNHTGVSGESGDAFLALDKSMLIRKNFGFWLWCRYRFRELKHELKISLGIRVK
jgi:glycosyltransferase involved in cell wall biosynthesis